MGAAQVAHRNFYLAAYDVSHPRRLAAALSLVRGFSTGGQRSVYELFLTCSERIELLHNMALILDEDADRFLLLRLDTRARCYALGIAALPSDPDYFYVG
jgi:CRISPR-associated protein Cas2